MSVGRWGGDLCRVVHSVNEGEPSVLTAAGPSIGRNECLPCWPVPRARGVLPCDIASFARQVLSSTFTAPVGWKSTAFHPEVRAVHRAIQRRERRPVVATLGRKIVVGQGVGEADLRSGIWTRGVVRARRLVCQAAPSKPLRPFWGWSNFPDLHGGMANIESRMSNDERHDPLHTKNATGTPAASVSFEIHHSSFDIRYCLKIFPVWFRLDRVRGDDLIRQSGDRLRDPPQGQEVPERALEPTPRIRISLRAQETRTRRRRRVSGRR